MLTIRENVRLAHSLSRLIHLALPGALAIASSPALAQLGPVPGLSPGIVGQPNGVAPLDAAGRASSLTVLPTGATTARTLAARAADHAGRA